MKKIETNELIKMEIEDPEEAVIDPDLFKNPQNGLFTTLNRNENDIGSQDQSQKQTEETEESSQYEWIKVIGQGTFGVVYKAQKKTGDKKIVAIKKVFQDPKYSNREFKIVVELDHPNCIKVHQFFFFAKRK